MLLECVVLCVKVLDGVGWCCPPLEECQIVCLLLVAHFEGWSTLLRGEACPQKKLPSCQRASNKGESKPDILENVSF